MSSCLGTSKTAVWCVGTSTLKEGGKELTFICEPPAAENPQSDAEDD